MSPAQISAPDSSNKKILPAIIPGLRASEADILLSPKVINRLKEFEYVPYSALLPGAREQFEDPDSSIRPFFKAEREISQIDWYTASKIVETRIEAYHDAGHAEALRAHNQVIRRLAHTYDWSLVLQYDINQRLAWENNPSIDISILDQDAWNMLMTMQLCKNIREPSPERDTTPRKYRRMPQSRRT